MMFDTGGVEAITPETATALGLLVEGQGTVRGSGERAVSVALTHLQALRLGGAELSDIALPMIPLPQFITDRGNRAPLAGLIGFGVLSRFTVRLSYDEQTLTLTPAGDFRYSGRGERVHPPSPTKLLSFRQRLTGFRAASKSTRVHLPRSCFSAGLSNDMAWRPAIQAGFA